MTAALHLIRTQGVKGFAQTRIAKASGIPQGHITYYFPKKADLLKAVSERYFGEVVKELEAIHSPEEAMGLLRRYARDRERTRTLMALLIEADVSEPLREALGESTNTMMGVVGGLVGRPGLDVEVDLMMCTLWGIALRHMLKRGRADGDRVDELLELVFQRGMALPDRDAKKKA